MRILIAASLLACASAFTTPQPMQRAFTSPVQPRVEEEQANAHRNRRATIVMDGKANGTLLLGWMKEAVDSPVVRS